MHSLSRTVSGVCRWEQQGRRGFPICRCSFRLGDPMSGQQSASFPIDLSSRVFLVFVKGGCHGSSLQQVSERKSRCRWRTCRPRRVSTAEARGCTTVLFDHRSLMGARAVHFSKIGEEISRSLVGYLVARRTGDRRWLWHLAFTSNVNINK